MPGVRVRCPGCGRFCRFEPFYGRWFCDRCERVVPQLLRRRLLPPALRLFVGGGFKH